MGRALAQPGAYPNPAKRLALFDAAMEACDALDGVADGVISHQNACNTRFDPSTAMLRGVPLRCPGGADTGDSCLSDAQITALKKINSPFSFKAPMLNGDTDHPGFNVWGADTGITAWNRPTQAYVSLVNFNTSQPAFPMPVTAPFMAILGDQWVRYFVARDPNLNSLGFDPENLGPWTERVQEVSRLLDAKTDISAFQARGGKLLIAHGLADTVVSSRPTQEYYRRLQAQFGPSKVAGFVRYYEVPGYGHASSQVFNAAWDSLTALDAWRVDGTIPVAQVVTDITGVPGRTRPMCEYPAWPRYKGRGDANLAASFECAQ
jgi:feruloyl esterase